MAETLRAGLSKESLPVTIDSPVYSARIVELDEITVAFETIKADVDTSPIFRGLPDDRCPCPHWGLVVRGQMTMSYRDRDEVFKAGEVFYNPAGHLPRCTPDTELITFSPTEQVKEVNAHLVRVMTALAGAQEAQS